MIGLKRNTAISTAQMYFETVYADVPAAFLLTKKGYCYRYVFADKSLRRISSQTFWSAYENYIGA